MKHGHAQFQGIFLDFFGTLAAGDREVVHAISAQVVNDLGLDAGPETFAETWGDEFFRTVGRSNGTRFRILYDCECASLTATVQTFGNTREVDPHRYVQTLQAYWRHPPLHREVHTF